MHLFLCLVLLILLAGCRNETVTPVPVLKKISFDFETSLNDWLSEGGSGERKFENDIILTDKYAASGNYACQFTVSPQSLVANGNRAELTFDQEAEEGTVSWYEWSFLIPEDYPDVTLKDPDGAPNWQVIGQWHQQPVFNEGETWDDFTGMGSSPPVAVYYNFLSAADPSYQAALNDPKSQTVYGFDQTWNQVPTITISYGLKSVAISEFKKGEWVRLRINIRWSEGEDGFIQVWQNEKMITNGKVYGPNMLNKASHYFKFGLYRNPSIPLVQVLYYDDVVIY